MGNLRLLKAILELEDKLSSPMNKAADGVVSNTAKMAKAAAATAAAAGAAFTVFAVKATEAASRAEETQNLFEVSFGGMAKQAEDWAQRTNAAIGVNDTTLKTFSGTLFNMTTSMGVTREGAFALATGFTELALDASSFFNTDFDSAFRKIQSGLAGQSEPLREWGINVQENAIKATGFAKAIEAAGREMSESEKIQARAIVIAEGLKNAAGDLIRTQDSWANQTRLAGEAWTDLLETAGAFITNSPLIGKVLSAITETINNLTSSLKTNEGAWRESTEGGVLFMLTAMQQTIKVFAYTVDAIGSVIAGVGKLLEWFAKLAQFVLDTTPLYKALPDSIVQNMQNAVDAITGTAAAATEAGKIVFEQGQKLHDGAENAQHGIDRLVNSTGQHGKATEEAATAVSTYDSLLKKLTESSIAAAGETKNLEKKTKEAKKAFDEWQIAQLEGASLLFDSLANQEQFQLDFRDAPEQIDTLNEGLGDVVDGVGDINALTEKAKKAQEDYNQALAAAADLAQIIGGELGRIVGQTLAAGSALQNLSSMGGEGGILGGLGAAFKGGKGDASGLLGLLGGIGGVAGAVGPLIGLGTTLFKGLASLFHKGPDIVRDAARDLGATITQEMADSIEKSGKPVQLAVADMIRAGAFKGDTARALEEVGDIFSGLGRGEFSKPEAITAIEDSVKELLPQLDQLGASGVYQMERILAAAQASGLGFQGMDDFAAAYVQRARELGIAVNDVTLNALGLQDALANPTAPQTMEQIAEQFKISNDEVRELAGLMGTEVQTNLERMAANAGLSVDEFKALADTLRDKMGVSLEEIGPLIEAMGGDAKALAQGLGIDVAGGADDVDEGLQNSNAQLDIGIDKARIFADELGRAAANAAGIGGFGSFPSGPPGFPVTGAASGFKGEVTGPHGFFIEPGVREHVDIGPTGGDAAMLAELRAINSRLAQLPKATRDAVLQVPRR